MSNQHNRSHDRVKSDARRARDSQRAAAMTQKLELPDEDRQTGGAVVWAVACFVVVLIIAMILTANFYFDRAERNINGGKTSCSQEK